MPSRLTRIIGRRIAAGHNAPRNHRGDADPMIPEDTHTAAAANEAARRGEYEALAAELLALRESMLALAQRAERRLAAVDPAFRDSARNLLHYLALRQHELRPLQERLARLGLSSLGRAESHVLATVDAVLDTVSAVLGRPLPRTPPPGPDFDEGRELLKAHSDALLGPAPEGRSTRIMVTMPRECADDEALVGALLQRGMDGMRINCAHDDAAIWQRIIGRLHDAAPAPARPCRILMDLGGPKLRTGPLPLRPAVLKLRPQRDLFGRVQRPCRIWLTATHAAPVPDTADAVVPVRSSSWLSRLKDGDDIELLDARGASRRWQVIAPADGGCWAQSERSCYLVPQLRLRRRGAGHRHGGHATTSVAALPRGENFIPLQQGDPLLLIRGARTGRLARTDSSGRVLRPAAIACLPPEVLDDVEVGDPIWFDDGRIGGVIEALREDGALVRITQVPERGAKLRAGKGINLPRSHLRTAALTGKDLSDLDFVAAHADMAGLSFVNRVEDIERLQAELNRRGGPPPAIVLKIETARAFRHLPELLLAAMRAPACGVMIARGDLAVECGFERLAEVQEELLWLCEAAHVPVIWATQVLESLAKDGLPSRAEITDAAMGHRAECVMLNKGPHILNAVEALDDILRRMQQHESKKTAQLRALHLATVFMTEPPAPV
jgi:pyruvate kinase